MLLFQDAQGIRPYLFILLFMAAVVAILYWMVKTLRRSSVSFSDEKKKRIISTAIGVVAGGFLGFLLRPSVPLIGQLPFDAVITRGGSLRGFDQVLVLTAQTSFNYLLFGIVVGGSIGFGISYFIGVRKDRFYASNPPEGSNLTSAAEPATGDIALRISEIASLRDRGILSEEEFQTKKTELLQRI